MRTLHDSSHEYIRSSSSFLVIPNLPILVMTQVASNDNYLKRFNKLRADEEEQYLWRASEVIRMTNQFFRQRVWIAWIAEARARKLERLMRNLKLLPLMFPTIVGKFMSRFLAKTTNLKHGDNWHYPSDDEP